AAASRRHADRSAKPARPDADTGPEQRREDRRGRDRRHADTEAVVAPPSRDALTDPGRNRRTHAHAVAGPDGRRDARVRQLAGLPESSLVVLRLNDVAREDVRVPD